jgi:hypothetical protein
MLALSGDDSDPLFLVYKSNSDTPEPILGQDGRVRYKVMKGEVSPGSDYSSRPSRESVVRDCEIRLLLQPYALGRRQILASAKGHVAVVRSHSDSSEVVGIALPYNATNHFSNPIFAHNTWSNKWSSAAGMTAYVNTDKRFVFSGERSVLCVALPSGSRVMYEALTLTVGTYTLSFKAKRRDGAAIDASTCQVHFNNANQTSTYRSIGDGWYIVSYTGTASASLTNYGVALPAGSSVYVDDFQCEGTITPMQAAHADSLGCSPSAAYHDSATLKGAGQIKYTASKNPRLLGSGTISAIVTVPAAGYASSFWVFQEKNSSFSLYWEYPSARWVFGDLTNVVTSNDALSAPKRIHFHCV